MAQIPLNQKIRTIDASVDTTERQSKLINSKSEVYTMGDIISTVNEFVGGGLEGTQYIYVTANGTDTENATKLQSAYDTAKTMSPSATNRITVICGNGNYNFSSNFVMDTQYIDLVSLDGNRSIIFNGTGTISITANDVFVKGVDVGNKNFSIANGLNLLKVENCKGGTSSFGPSATVSGTFTDCQGGLYSFGGFGGGIASGVFNNCIGGESSFGGLGGIASGTFTDCQGGNGSFGGIEFFGGATASGIFTNCQGGNLSFGGEGTASGTFTNCVGGNGSFAGGGGTISGKLYYCRLTAGAFTTVSGTGVTRLCIDGSNNENNQG